MVLAAILGPTSHKIEIQTVHCQLWHYLGLILDPQMAPTRPPDAPQTSKNIHHVVIRFGPVLNRSWEDLRPILGSTKWFSQWLRDSFLHTKIFEQKNTARHLGINLA